MNLKSILKTVGGGLISTLVPGGPAIVAGINALLPDDDKIPENATGDQAAAAISRLPADKQAEIMLKDYDVKLEEIRQPHDSLRTMLTANATSTHTTRPHIALGCFYILAFSAVMATIMWAYSIWEDKAAMTKAIVDGWPFVLAVNGTFATLLLAYFGVLRKEQKQQLDAAQGISPAQGLAGLVGRVAGAIRG